MIGGKIIDHYRSYKGDEKVFFIVDTNQIRNVTLRAGRMLLKHQLPDNIEVSLYDVSSSVKRSMAYLSFNNVKRKNINVRQDETDALLDIFQKIGQPYYNEKTVSNFANDTEKPVYQAVFEELWEKEKKMITIGDYQYRQVMLDD